MARKPWYKRKRNKWIIASVAVPLAVALIGGAFLIASSLFQRAQDTQVELRPAIELQVSEADGTDAAAGKGPAQTTKSSLCFEEIEPGELQSTNLPREELATYRFVLRNRGLKPACVSGGQFVPTRVSFDGYPAHHLMYVPEIQHRGHVPVPVHQPKVGTPVLVPLDFAVPPGKPYEFTLWFRLDSTTQETRLGLLDVVGTLTLSCDDGEISSDPFRMSLCSIPNAKYRAQPRANQ
jgi:hypothetical protein